MFGGETEPTALQGRATSLLFRESVERHATAIYWIGLADRRRPVAISLSCVYIVRASVRLIPGDQQPPGRPGPARPVGLACWWKLIRGVRAADLFRSATVWRLIHRFTSVHRQHLNLLNFRKFIIKFNNLLTNFVKNVVDWKRNRNSFITVNELDVQHMYILSQSQT